MLDHDQRLHRWRMVSYHAICAISDIVGDPNLRAQIINSKSQGPEEYLKYACQLFDKLTTTAGTFSHPPDQHSVTEILNTAYAVDCPMET
eukprot:5746349-Karenia_brevis.AAC.1